MSSYAANLIGFVLVLIAIILSIFGVYYYYKGNRQFASGDFTRYSTWMFYGVIIYTLHLFAHLVHALYELEWINVNENFVYFNLYIFLAIAGFFFLVGGYLYLNLADSLGVKK